MSAARPTPATNFRQSDLAPTEERAAIYRVRAALRELAAVLPAVPSPEWWWYDLNRDRIAADQRLTLMCRTVLSAAKGSGCAETLRRARALVDVVLDEQRAAIFLGHEAPDAVPLTLMTASLAKEMGEAITSAARLAAHPSESNRHTARVQLAEAVDAGFRAKRALCSTERAPARCARP